MLRLPKQSENGFSVIEFLILIGVLALLCFSAWFVYDKHNTNPIANTHKTLGIYVNSYSNAAWLTFKSKHSSVKFQYPADWKLQTSSQQNDNNTLEYATITGPGGTNVLNHPTLS